MEIASQEFKFVISAIALDIVLSQIEIFLEDAVIVAYGLIGAFNH